MVHEKIFKIETNREVKVIVKCFPSPDRTTITKFFEIKVRHDGQIQFTDQSKISLPVPSQITKADQKRLARQLLAQNGISENDIQQAVKEFDQILDSSVLW